MFITDLFKFTKQCAHDKVTPDKDCAYCPDCGKFIKNEWYITRCSCCGVKMRAVIKNGEVIPQNHYCSNCGSKEYTVEKIPQINFIDINFAVLKKVVLENKPEFTMTSCWEEKTPDKPKLLVQYL